MNEALAIQIVNENKGKAFEHEGKKGHFEILEDLNCCAPTQDVLFAFVMETSRKVMTADQFLDFYERCKAL